LPITIGGITKTGGSIKIGQIEEEEGVNPE
jgi:hypothetical protein